MRYVIVHVLKEEAGEFNNSLRKEIFKDFKVKSSKLPAHFTIKAPFEYDNEIADLNNILEEFSKNEKAESFTIDGYDHFKDRVIFMKVNMSEDAKNVHNRLIDKMDQIPYIEFDEKDGKNKIFHVTLASKNLKPLYNKVWEYVNRYSCEFKCNFDNITIYKWKEGTWKLYKEFKLGSSV